MAAILYWIRETDPIHPTVSTAPDFLVSLYEQNLSYSSINTARCALSAIIDLPERNQTFGQHADVKRFMKGTFQNRPSKPRYNKTRDVKIVLKHITSMPETEALTLKQLTLIKTCHAGCTNHSTKGTNYRINGHYRHGVTKGIAYVSPCWLFETN